MSDERLRELERAWRASGSWDDWSAWARETRRSSDPDPWLLLHAIERFRVLEARRNRMRRIFDEFTERAANAEWLGPYGRIFDDLGSLRRRIVRALARLSRSVPFPPIPAGRNVVPDWRAAAIRMSVRDAQGQLRRRGPRTTNAGATIALGNDRCFCGHERDSHDWPHGGDSVESSECSQCPCPRFAPDGRGPTFEVPQRSRL